MTKKSYTYKGKSKPFGRSGHFNESRRHSLQAKGIKTGNLAKSLPPGGFEHKYTFSSVADKDIITVWMKPEEFLKHAYEEYRLRFIKNPSGVMMDFDEYKDAVLRPQNVDKIKNLIKRGKGVSIPFLEFDKWGRPIEHEGRHTAQASINLGLEYIPVTLERRKHQYKWEKPPRFVQTLYYDKIDFKDYKKYPDQPVDDKFIYKPKE